MKPLYLSIQAFGPFSDKEDIDFKKLGTYPLFLINGPTGAGKSSILDAICFALYGQTTGAERTASQMRCDHAKPDVLTQVCLDFSIGDKVYRIKRIPMQARVKKNGEGTTSQQSEATLWELDNTENNRLIVSKKVSEADSEIKVLLGLNVEQFRQVMVLPQGKFRDLLLADSKDREKIFSQLFQTSIYKRIEEKLKLEASEIKKQVDQHQNQVLGIIKSVGLELEEDVTKELASLSEQLNIAKENKDKANDKLKVCERSLEAAQSLNKQFASLSVKKEALAKEALLAPIIEVDKKRLSHALKAEKINFLFEDKRKLIASKERLTLSLKSCSDKHKASKALLELRDGAFNQAEAAYSEVDTLKEKRSELAQYDHLLVHLNNELIETQKVEEKAFNSESIFHKAKEKSREQIKLLLTQEKESDKLKLIITSLSSSQVALEKITQVLEYREKLHVVHLQQVQLKQESVRLKETVSEAEKNHEKCIVNTKEVELLWHTSQAEILSKALQKGKPCPVCGGLEHPKPIVSNHDDILISKDDVDSARKEEFIAKKQLDKCKLSLATSLEKANLNIQQSDDLTIQLGDMSNKTLEDVKFEKENVEQKVFNLLAQEKKLNDTILLINKIKVDIEQGAEKEKFLEIAMNEDKHNLIEKKSIITQLQKQIPKHYRQTDTLQIEINTINKKVEALTQQLNTARSAKLQIKSDLDKQETTLHLLEKQIHEEEGLLSLAVNRWDKALLASPFELEKHFFSALISAIEQQEITQRIESFKSNVDKLTAVIKQLEQDLSEAQVPNLSQLGEELEQANLLFISIDNTFRQLSERNYQLESVSEMLIKAHVNNQVLEKKYQVIGTLYEVSNGLTGDKVSLQRFVLSVLLDDVLIQASVRLSLMSKGRYQLFRKNDKAKGNKASGLELEVADAYTGKTRSVATLSGGESFLAALSLALGVSDVVQSYAGGIKLETLFIDEGFGSLDPDSLELAIRALIDLQSNGRMIGIISHVSELKEQMALRIDVKSGKYGSEISLLTD